MGLRPVAALTRPGSVKSVLEYNPYGKRRRSVQAAAVSVEAGVIWTELNPNPKP